MSNAVFPSATTLPGMAWPVVKRPLFNSKVQQSVSLREVRAAFAPYPQWRWTIPFSVLRMNGSNVELQTLLNFFLARQGQFDSFLYDDSADDTATAQVFGTGDGGTVAFQLIRSLTVGGFAEPVYNTNSTPVIKDNGVTKTAGVDYNINGTGLVTFTVAPVAGHLLTWSGTYYWRARFDVDSADFSQFVSQFFELKALSFVSVLGS